MHENKNISPPPPTAMSPTQYADRVGKVSAAVSYGDNPIEAIGRVREGTRRLDPIEVAHIAEPGPVARMETAFGRVATIAEVAMGEKKAKKSPWPIDRFRTEVTLDQADMALRSPHPDHTSVTGILRGVIDATAREQEKGGKEVKETALFDGLTAKAMLLHLDARQVAESNLEPRLRAGSEAILKASLGGLIIETVKVMGGFYKSYQAIQKKGGAGTHVSGRLVEIVYFGYELLQWYKTNGSLADGYPRFAVNREDKPNIGVLKENRSFDVASRNRHAPESPKLVQVKSKPAGGYAAPIKVWSPEHPNAVDLTGEIVKAFNTIIENETNESDVAAAWRTLHAYLGET